MIVILLLCRVNDLIMTLPLLITAKLFAVAWHVQPKMNDKLYLKDPEQSDVGKKIFKNSIKLIKDIGFEAFTFKKLAAEMKSTEATIYRYFENKHRLLNYLVAWYWHWLDYQVVFQTNNIISPEKKLQKIINILTWQIDGELADDKEIDWEDMHQIIIRESSKVYLTNHVIEDNTDDFFQPYKNLCERISDIMKEYNPNYAYTRSLSSTLIESAHFQDYFLKNLPALTDFEKNGKLTDIRDYLTSLVFSALNYNRAQSN